MGAKSEVKAAALAVAKAAAHLEAAKRRLEAAVAALGPAAAPAPATKTSSRR